MIGEALRDRSLVTSSKAASYDINDIHSKFGHVGSAAIKSTLRSVYLNPIFKNKIMRESCLQGNTRHQKISKQSKNPPQELLEVIEIDLQGTFPYEDIHGCKSNLKFIDGKSGYVKTKIIPDKTSATIKDCFQKFTNRMERLTGKRIINVRCDSGTEFKGSFVEYLNEKGITKQSGIPYEHHIPGKVEICHQTILRIARSMLIFYSEAILAASYLTGKMLKPLMSLCLFANHD
jgi:hypothetical protein